jgi:RNA recognition motif-containing protein
VKFKRRIDAETAKREMDGRVLGGRRIRTGWGDANTQRHCVHIQFDPASPTEDSSPAGVLSETDLFTAFSPYGTVLNVHLPRTASRLRGFGFVRYSDTDEGEESAEAAVSFRAVYSLQQTRKKCFPFLYFCLYPFPLPPFLL